ncbi:MAG TPA: deoxyribose-phosphate aldolase [Coriobacteriia bacterium]|nr:deoxyribose-phosphate aldolase [Coriobacteriia bacterium]
MDRVALAAAIDQTLLRPTAGPSEAREWMMNSRDAGFASLCVPPFLVPHASEILAGTATRVCSVCGFPLGYSLTETKAEEARQLVRVGCQEVDMVLNVAAFLAGDVRGAHDDVRAVVDAVASVSSEAIVKVILETGYLTEEEIRSASRLCVEAGAHFVKTSTGFGPRGASTRDVRLMRGAVGPRVGVKASGGIRDLRTALEMLDAGADRIGTSSGLEILAARDDLDRCEDDG